MAIIKFSSPSIRSRLSSRIGASYFEEFKKAQLELERARTLFEADRNSTVATLAVPTGLGATDAAELNTAIGSLKAATSKDEIINIIRTLKLQLDAKRAAVTPTALPNIPTELKDALDLLAGDTTDTAKKAAVIAKLDSYTPPVTTTTRTLTAKERRTNALAALRTPATPAAPTTAPSLRTPLKWLSHHYGRAKTAVDRAKTAYATTTATTTTTSTAGDDEKLRDALKTLSGTVCKLKDAADTHYAGVKSEDERKELGVKAYLELKLFGEPWRVKKAKREVDQLYEVYDGLERLRSLPGWEAKPDISKIDSTKDFCNLGTLFPDVSGRLGKLDAWVTGPWIIGGEKGFVIHGPTKGTGVIATKSKLELRGTMTNEQVMAALEHASVALGKDGLKIKVGHNEKQLGYQIIAALEELHKKDGTAGYNKFKINIQNGGLARFFTFGIWNHRTFYGAGSEVSKRKIAKLAKHKKHQAGIQQVDSTAAPSDKMADLAAAAHGRIAARRTTAATLSRT